jgi:putative hydrolase of the HAD superfamily
MDAARFRFPGLPRTIETVLFDFGGTLDADGVAWMDRFRALYEAEGLVTTADAFAPAFFAADDPLVGGLASSAGLKETVRALAANLEAQLDARGSLPGAEQADGDRSRSVAERFLSDASIIFARNRPVLEALAGRCRLGVVSNFYGNLEAVCASSGLAPFFGVMADSHRVGAKKPDPAIFRAALDALVAAPETTLYVGDSLRRDCEGARRAGLSFVWITPEGAGTEAHAAAPVAASLSELPQLLDLLE